MNWEADQFNAKFPVGANVWYWRGGAEVFETTVSEPAVFDEVQRKCFVRLEGVKELVHTRHVLPVTEWYRHDLQPVLLGVF